MGQNTSIIQDEKLRISTKKAFDISMALMIINLVLISIPTMAFYWIPYAGPWVIQALSIIQNSFSFWILKLSASHIPQYGNALPKTHMAISLLMGLLITISCIMQTVHWNDMQTYCSTYGYDGYSYSYCYTYSGYNYYLPSLVIMGIITPILSLIHLIVFSINCSYIWNEMNGIVLKIIHQGTPLRTASMQGQIVYHPTASMVPTAPSGYVSEGYPVYGTFPQSYQHGRPSLI